ncbi:MAG: GTPase ObgE [Phycisphaerae bacterium]
MHRSTGTTKLFVDEVNIHVRGGKGGDGSIAFHREKFVPKGGPSGGDGGHGGSVWLVAKDGIDTLLDLAGRHHYHAQHGEQGLGKKCHGKRGRELIVEVPTGTLIYDAETGRLLKDLVENDQKVLVARGGRGGWGNVHFASSTNQTPRYAQPGRKGEERTLRLELKLIADVGFVGLPNAGKSTLLSRLTNARPKIAAYPFTTKEPQLGILELVGFRRLVLADIPGLLEGAHEGFGLGDAFLKHIERTRVIVHLIDLCPPSGAPMPIEAYHIIRGELEKYSPRLAERTEILVGTKTDLTDAEVSMEMLREDLPKPIMAISGVTGQGLKELAEAMWTAVDEVKREERERAPQARIDFGAAPKAVAVDAVAATGPMEMDTEPDAGIDAEAIEPFGSEEFGDEELLFDEGATDEE